MPHTNQSAPLDTGELPVVPAHERNYPQNSDETAAESTEKPKVPVQLKVLIVAAFCIALGFGLIAPVLPRFAASFDVGATAAALVVSMFAVMRLAFAPASGKIVTKLGERHTYIAGLLIVALSSLGVSFSWDYWSLLAFRAFGGVGSVMFTVSAMGLIVRYAPLQLRGRISGYYATSFLLGNILGPVLGSLIAGLGMRLPFMIYAVALFIASAVVFFYLKDAPQQGVQTKTQKPALTLAEAWKFENYKAALTSNFAMGWTALGIRVSMVPLAAVALLSQYHAGQNYDSNAGGTVLAGIALALYAAGNAITQNISGPLSDRWGRRRFIFWGLLIAGLATVAVGWAPSPLLFCVFSVFTGVGTGLLGPSLQASVADVIGNFRSGGTVLSTFQMCSDLGQIVGPLVAGLIVDLWGFQVAFAVSGAILLLTGLGWVPGRRPAFPPSLADEEYTGK